MRTNGPVAADSCYIGPLGPLGPLQQHTNWPCSVSINGGMKSNRLTQKTARFYCLSQRVIGSTRLCDDSLALTRWVKPFPREVTDSAKAADKVRPRTAKLRRPSVDSGYFSRNASLLNVSPEVAGTTSSNKKSDATAPSRMPWGSATTTSWHQIYLAPLLRSRALIESKRNIDKFRRPENELVMVLTDESRLSSAEFPRMAQQPAMPIAAYSIAPRLSTTLVYRSA